MQYLFSCLFVFLMTFTPVAMAAENALVFGGTGRLGSYIVKDLINAGHSVTVFARPTSNRNRLAGLDVDYTIGDLGNDSEIASSVEQGGFTVLIDASGRRANDFSYAQDQSMRQMVKSAEKSGVRQIIFISSVGAGDNIKQFPHIKWGEYIGFLEERGAAEKALFDGGVPYTIIRTGGVVDEDVPASGKGQLLEDQAHLGMITRPDLAGLVVECVGNPACHPKVYHSTDSTLAIPQEALN